VANAYIQAILPKIEKFTRQQHVFRWGTFILVGVLGVLELWQWSWLVLGLAAFASMIDIGLALVVGQVNPVASDLQAEEATRAQPASKRAA